MQEAMSDKELSKEEIKDLLKDIEYPLIFDIGAYDGRDSIALAKALQDRCSIHCFEADPRSFEYLKKNIQSCEIPNFPFDLHKLAIGKNTGVKDFYQSESDTRRHVGTTSWSASSSLSRPKEHLNLFPDVFFPEKIRVNCQSLDGFVFTDWTHLREKIVDFVWCDVNGAERDVILGGLHTLNNYTRYLYIEFSNKELYEGQVSKEELLKLLPNFEELGVYNFQGNFGNVLLKNKTL